MSEFLFAGKLWFIAPAPPYESMAELAALVLAGEFGDGRDLAVYVFSDDDLAERFLKRSNAPPHYQPFAPDDDEELIALLVELYSREHRHLGIDAESRGHDLMPIPDAIAQIRGRSG